MTIEIEENLYSKISQYCAINDFDINEKIHSFLREGFNIEKYGSSPFDETIEVKKIKEKTKKEVIISSKEEVPKMEEVLVSELKQEVPVAEEKPKRKRVRIIKN